jgi:serine O-acetyltransferase
MFELFKQDLQRWVIPQRIAPPEAVTTRVMLRLLFRHMPVRAMAWFRFGSWCKRQRLPFLPGWVQRQIYRRYGLEIKVGGDIAGGLYIAHPIGTVISPLRIGKNCTIIASVTIGMRNEWEFPALGDDVFVGAGARVLGGIEIGDGAMIGANAVVIHDIPAGATAVGIPARVIRYNGMRVEPALAEP